MPTSSEAKLKICYHFSETARKQFQWILKSDTSPFDSVFSILRFPFYQTLPLLFPWLFTFRWLLHGCGGLLCHTHSQLRVCSKFEQLSFLRAENTFWWMAMIFFYPVTNLFFSNDFHLDLDNSLCFFEFFYSRNLSFSTFCGQRA